MTNDEEFGITHNKKLTINDLIKYVTNRSIENIKKQRKIVDYIMVSKNDSDEFTLFIKEKIKEGYQPYGNPYQSYGEGWCIFFQAMVKYED